MPIPPAIRYVRTADGHDIAYWTRGRGRVLVHSPNVQLGHVRAEWSTDGMRRWYEALARSFTVVRYDHRGGGMSSRGARSQTIDALVEDIEAIVDEVSSEPVVFLGFISGGLPSIAYAARHPDRVSHLVLWCVGGRHASQGRAARISSLFQLAESDWELFTESICQAALGWRNAEEARRWARVIREGTTQAEFLALVEARRSWDVTPDLGRIEASTLVMHDAGNAIASEESSRELAAAIPGARYVQCSTADGAPDDHALEEIRGLVGSGTSGTDGSVALEALTAREREVLGLLVQGATNAQIAERLFITVNTVTRHLTHIYAKTGTEHRAQAVRYGLERGLGAG